MTNETIRKLKCSCLDSDVKDAIMASNLAPDLKQAFSNVRTCSDIIEIGAFMIILYEITKSIYFPSRYIIYKIRDEVVKRLGITNEEFYQYLIECVKKGWITLIEGSPLSGKESDWFDIAGRRFYYLAFVEDWKRRNRGENGILKFETDLGLK
jgi:hypothetical protein